MAEILLYESIHSYSSERFINALEEFKAEDVSIRINSPGGNPLSSWGMIAKMKEHKGKLNVKVDGAAYSMAAFMLLYADYIECLDVSEFLFHRAAYSASYEMEMNDESRKDVVRTNKQLRAAFESKIDVKKFEELKGVTVDAMFSLENRIDVTLTAEEAKAIGLVDKIVNIQPTELSALQDKFYKLAAEARLEKPKIEANKETKNKNSKTDKMTIEKLKSDHPELYAEVVKNATENERERSKSWLVFADVDLEAVKKGIVEGEDLKPSLQAEFSRKSLSATFIKGAEGDSAKDVDPGAAGKEATAEEKSLEAFKKDLYEKRKNQ